VGQSTGEGIKVVVVVVVVVVPETKVSGYRYQITCLQNFRSCSIWQCAAKNMFTAFSQ
jgi:hypothetical protein